MHRYRRFPYAFGALALLVMLAAVSCSDSGTTPADDHDGSEELEFALTFGSPELETLQAVTLELAIEDHHGDHQMDFDDVEMQYRMENETEWESIPMAVNGDHFAGTHMFMSSGRYEMRVMGVAGHNDGHGHRCELGQCRGDRAERDRHPHVAHGHLGHRLTEPQRSL